MVMLGLFAAYRGWVKSNWFIDLNGKYNDFVEYAHCKCFLKFVKIFEVEISIVKNRLNYFANLVFLI